MSILRPIQTYYGRDVAKPGIVKRHHAVIYTGREPPRIHREEKPSDGEWGMLKPIRVIPRDRRNNTDEKSRINYGKIYTVEHNVKVYDFGDVALDSLFRLRNSWKRVLDEEYEKMMLNRADEVVEDEDK